MLPLMMPDAAATRCCRHCHYAFHDDAITRYAVMLLLLLIRVTAPMLLLAVYILMLPPYYVAAIDAFLCQRAMLRVDTAAPRC